MAENNVAVVISPLDQLHADKLRLIDERNSVTSYIGGTEKTQMAVLNNKKKDKTSPPTPELYKRMDHLIWGVQHVCEVAGLVIDHRACTNFLEKFESALSKPSGRNNSAEAFNLELTKKLIPYFTALLNEERKLEKLGRDDVAKRA